MSPVGPRGPRTTLLFRLLFGRKADSLCSERALSGVTQSGRWLRRPLCCQRANMLQSAGMQNEGCDDWKAFFQACRYPSRAGLL
jgi:hypothetical protein